MDEYLRRECLDAIATFRRIDAARAEHDAVRDRREEACGNFLTVATMYSRAAMDAFRLMHQLVIEAQAALDEHGDPRASDIEARAVAIVDGFMTDLGIDGARKH